MEGGRDMNKFEEPKIEVLAFEVEDIITESNTEGGSNLGPTSCTGDL
jgi:hypothetical protein